MEELNNQVVEPSLLVRIDEKQQEEIKEKYNITNPIQEIGTGLMYVALSDFQMLLQNYEGKIELGTPYITLINIIQWYGKKVSKEFVELFIRIYIPKETMVNDYNAYNITNRVIDYSSKEVVEFVICGYLNLISDGAKEFQKILTCII